MFQSPCGDYTLIRVGIPKEWAGLKNKVSVPLRGLYPYKWLKVLYDADPTSVEYDETKQYVTTGNTEQVYCTVTKGDSVHWYQCTANCKGQDPTKTYTCGSPTSGGVIDSPRRTIEWFRRRVAALDSKWSYTPPTESATSSSIPASVIENIINA